MTSLPRLALRAVRHDGDLGPMAWALMALLEQRGIKVQHFLTEARHPRLDGAGAITGLPTRQMDSWSMGRNACREVFFRSLAAADFALVENTCCRVHGGPFSAPGGEPLDQLASWLELPCVGVLDVTRLTPCRLPERPTGVDALLLDRLSCPEQFYYLQTNLEALWGIPVIGGLDELGRLRAEMSWLGAGQRPSEHIAVGLGSSLARYTSGTDLLRLACRLPIGPLRYAASQLPELVRFARQLPPLTVALALDSAFKLYFPDTIDLLEQLGAQIVDFSPLYDGALPAEADLVYLGTGPIEQHACRLAENCCMQMALRDHLRQGKRILAEGAAVAYLSRRAELPDGRGVRMAGLIDAVAHYRNGGTRPAEVRLAENCWLAGAGTEIRGYLDDSWSLEPGDEPRSLVRTQGPHRYDMIGDDRLVASRVLLHHTATHGMLRSFFEPSPPAASCEPAASRSPG